MTSGPFDSGMSIENILNRQLPGGEVAAEAAPPPAPGATGATGPQGPAGPPGPPGAAAPAASSVFETLDPAKIHPLGGETRAWRHLSVPNVLSRPRPQDVGPWVLCVTTDTKTWWFSDGVVWTMLSGTAAGAGFTQVKVLTASTGLSGSMTNLGSTAITIPDPGTYIAVGNFEVARLAGDFGDLFQGALLVGGVQQLALVEDRGDETLQHVTGTWLITTTVPNTVVMLRVAMPGASGSSVEPDDTSLLIFSATGSGMGVTLHQMADVLAHYANAHKMFYSNSAGAIVELALDTNGKVLTSTGPSSAPVFAAPTGGAGIGFSQQKNTTSTYALTGSPVAVPTSQIVVPVAGTYIAVAQFRVERGALDKANIRRFIATVRVNGADEPEVLIDTATTDWQFLTGAYIITTTGPNQTVELVAYMEAGADSQLSLGHTSLIVFSPSALNIHTFDDPAFHSDVVAMTEATGDMLYRTSAAKWDRRAIGAVGTTLSPVGGIPVWSNLQALVGWLNAQGLLDEVPHGVGVRAGFLGGGGNFQIEDNTGRIWEVDAEPTGGLLRFFQPGSVKMTLDSSGNLTLLGNIVMGSGKTVDGIDVSLHTHATGQGGVVSAADVSYAPSVLANWNSGAGPGDVDNALDQLASRQKSEIYISFGSSLEGLQVAP